MIAVGSVLALLLILGLALLLLLMRGAGEGKAGRGGAADAGKEARESSAPGGSDGRAKTTDGDEAPTQVAAKTPEPKNGTDSPDSGKEAAPGTPEEKPKELARADEPSTARPEEKPKEDAPARPEEPEEEEKPEPPAPSLLFDKKLAAVDRKAVETPPSGARVGGSFSQRTGAAKEAALRAGGGTEETERAVHLALDWLKRHQYADGGWAGLDMDRLLPVPAAPGRPETRLDKAPGPYASAVTGLALLCFLGAGETERSKTYGETVRRGLAYLLKAQGPEGTYPGTRNYGLAICTMALAEAQALHARADVKQAAVRSVKAILIRQCPAGGWDYEGPGPRNDMSVSGWCMLALKSASAAGIAGSKEAYPKFRRLMDATLGARTGGWYDARGEGRLVSIQTGTAMHAVAMLCRLLLGEHGTPALLQGADIQVQRLPDWHSRNTYHICYCTLSLFQIGEPTWKTWNSHVSKMLVENQRKDGDAAGSWDPNGNDWGVGRTYATTLCCLSLEVYYRYAALYR